MGLLFAASTTVVVAVPQPAAALELPPPALVEVVASATVVAVATVEGLPRLSCDCTVAIAEQLPAVIVCVAVMKASFAAGCGLIVSTCEALASEPDEAVMLGAPEAVSLK